MRNCPGCGKELNKDYVERNSIRIMIFALTAAMSSRSMARRKRGWMLNLKTWTMIRI